MCVFAAALDKEVNAGMGRWCKDDDDDEDDETLCSRKLFWRFALNWQQKARQKEPAVQKDWPFLVSQL